MFAIPTLSDLYTRVMNAFMAYASLDASLPLNNVAPTAKVFAGHSSEIFGRMDYIGQQAFVLTADANYLPLHGRQYNIPQLPALPAQGNLNIVSMADIQIPLGTLFTRGDGTQYAATAAVSLATAGTAIVPVLAQAVGAVTNCAASAPMTIGAGVTGDGALTATASVGPNGIIGGADIEDLEAWRARILFRLRYPPHGGAPSDYVMWSTAVPGVTRAYVWRRYGGPGTVQVYPIFDDYFAAQGGIAPAPYISAVNSAIQAVAPATAFINVIAPTPQPINITVAGLSPFTAPVKQAVMGELQDMFRRLGAVSGGDTPISGMPFLATPQTFSASWIWQAIANASGEQRHTLLSPSADVVIASNCLPVLGSVSLSA